MDAKLVNADGQRDRLTDTKRPIAAFQNFAKAPKNNMQNIIK